MCPRKRKCERLHDERFGASSFAPQSLATEGATREEFLRRQEKPDRMEGATPIPENQRDFII
jgi:hypothetical protein